MMTIRPMTRLCSLVFDRLELVDGQAKDWLMGLSVMNACTPPPPHLYKLA